MQKLCALNEQKSGNWKYHKLDPGKLTWLACRCYHDCWSDRSDARIRVDGSCELVVDEAEPLELVPVTVSKHRAIRGGQLQRNARKVVIKVFGHTCTSLKRKRHEPIDDENKAAKSPKYTQQTTDEREWMHTLKSSESRRMQRVECKSKRIIQCK